MSEDVASYLGVRGDPVELRERSATPSAALERLAALAPWLERSHQRIEEGEVPSLELRGRGAHGSLRFVGTISGHLLEALIVLARALATHELELDTPATLQLLAELDAGRSIELYVGPHCPFCPSVMAAALRLGAASERVAVTILRADEVAHPLVRSVPTLLLAGSLAHVGAIHEYELAALVCERKGERAGPRKSGR
ncbi:MAG: hypothetical protein OEY14_09750 [Myxococcales bacterium]|nr:hypothetical protein [Myxococcales bacterium]